MADNGESPEREMPYRTLVLAVVLATVTLVCTFGCTLWILVHLIEANHWR